MLTQLRDVHNAYISKWPAGRYIRPNQAPAGNDLPFDPVWYKTQEEPVLLSSLPELDPDAAFLGRSEENTLKGIPQVWNAQAVMMRRILTVTSFMDTATDGLMKSLEGVQGMEAAHNLARALGDATGHIASSAFLAMTNTDLARRDFVLDRLPDFPQQALPGIRSAPLSGRMMFGVHWDMLRAIHPDFPKKPVPAQQTQSQNTGGGGRKSDFRSNKGKAPDRPKKTWGKRISEKYRNNAKKQADKKRKQSAPPTPKFKGDKGGK